MLTFMDILFSELLEGSMLSCEVQPATGRPLAIMLVGSTVSLTWVRQLQRCKGVWKALGTGLEAMVGSAEAPLTFDG